METEKLVIEIQAIADGVEGTKRKAGTGRGRDQRHHRRCRGSPRARLMKRRATTMAGRGQARDARPYSGLRLFTHKGPCKARKRREGRRLVRQGLELPGTIGHGRP